MKVKICIFRKRKNEFIILIWDLAVRTPMSVDPPKADSIGRTLVAAPPYFRGAVHT